LSFLPVIEVGSFIFFKWQLPMEPFSVHHFHVAINTDWTGHAHTSFSGVDGSNAEGSKADGDDHVFRAVLLLGKAAGMTPYIGRYQLRSLSRTSYRENNDNHL
jgi:hypothetical protein